ncbi:MULTISPECIES: tripartite tricarboxylate transporter TctB family protein [unclassified Neorhizobium]|uniref:tripartite tricarboxylate transporter TctB family protein n=1 Tax=unclassified Neorhizobium TaxID=2629175 RepID=UPI001FF59E25|nr:MULTISPECIES: tripartite tricarboxylate transporter TctB family protein [unclassified Neorhizobium]MCJ9669456.1 tripartite tricarboxylate transporter TctB family protein [Neorhizobium sp. SHOUNA12B]MCJ9745519.1 tripartite tricarboxylate transporter TctB family protein [Neorhizobium sp. SHOUNA12A]
MIIDPSEQQLSHAVPRYARVDVIGGVLLMMFAFLIWYGAIELEFGTIADIKSGALPKILSVALVLAGIGVFLEGLFQSPESSERLEIAVRPAALIIFSIGVFGFFIRGGKFGLVSTPQFGLLVVGPLTIFIAGCAADRLRLKSLLILAFGLTSALLLIFVDVLSVNIPVYPKAVGDLLNSHLGEYLALRAGYIAYAIAALGLYVILYMLPERNRG